MGKSILIAVLLLLVIVSSSAVACSKAPASVTLTDDQGTKVSIPSNPQRIVSLDAPITEIVFALGLGDRLVGIDDYSNYPKETNNITKLGSALPGFSTETILNQEPDLILTSAGTIVQQLDGHGVPEVLDAILKLFPLDKHEQSLMLMAITPVMPFSICRQHYQRA